MKQTTEERSRIGEIASAYFQNGYHCDEAVASAIVESKGMDPRQAVAHATPFGGGVGKSFCEMCGAMSGGLIAIGHVHGRANQGDNWDDVAAMGAALRNRFIENYGETGCGALRERFGEEQMVMCARLVQTIAEETHRILEIDE